MIKTHCTKFSKNQQKYSFEEKNGQKEHFVKMYVNIYCPITVKTAQRFLHLARVVQMYSPCYFYNRVAFKIFSDCHFELQSFTVTSIILHQLVNVQRRNSLLALSTFYKSMCSYCTLSLLGWHTLETIRKMDRSCCWGLRSNHLDHTVLCSASETAGYCKSVTFFPFCTIFCFPFLCFAFLSTPLGSYQLKEFKRRIKEAFHIGQFL